MLYDADITILKQRRKEDIYTIAAEFLMCKLHAHIELININAYDVSKFVNWIDFKNVANENSIIDDFASEAAAEAAIYFENSFIIPLDSLQKNWALSMVFWGNSKDYIELFGLEGIE